MRHGVAVVCLLAAAGCASENELRYTATLESITDGVALSDDGHDAVAAMAGTTCTIDTAFGCPTEDEDLPTDHEVVLDAFGGRTLGVSELGVHTLRGGAWVVEEDDAVAGVRTAGLLLGEGHVVVWADDAGCWSRVDRGQPVAQDDAACEDGARYAVDRVDGTLFAATVDGVLALEEDGTRPLGITGDLVAWDPKLRQLYVATRGEPGIYAYDDRGTPVWEVDTVGAVGSIATRGDRGEVLAIVRGDDGFGEVWRLRGEDGRRLGSSLVPDAEGDLVVSGNGLVVGIVREEEVNFFSITTGDEEPAVDDTPPTCIAVDQATAD